MNLRRCVKDLKFLFRIDDSMSVGRHDISASLTRRRFGVWRG